jgi:hypothetical protein
VELFRRELKSKIFREAIGVSLVLLVKVSNLDTVQSGEIGVEYHLLASDNGYCFFYRLPNDRSRFLSHRMSQS